MHSFTCNRNDNVPMDADSTSSVSSFSGFSNNQNQKFSKLKSLLNTIEKYLSTPNIDKINIINQQLQILNYPLDVTIFDPHRDIVGKFLISLINLMQLLDPLSITSGYCVDVLINVCKNTAARETLITTFNFLPNLARMLSDQLTKAKKIKLLKLIQDITYGVKIHTQMPYLTKLITILCEWIEQEDLQIITPSLGILVNLSYNNLAVISIFQRKINLKKLYRTCSALTGPIVEVYVSLLMINLDKIGGQGAPFVPSIIFPKLINYAFQAFEEARNEKNYVVLKQIVGFFMEYVHNHSIKLSNFIDKIIKRVGDLLENLKNLVRLDLDPEYICIFLEFINFLIAVANLSEINCLYLELINLSLKWIGNNAVSYQCVKTLKLITLEISQPEPELLEALKKGLKETLTIFNCAFKVEESPTSFNTNEVKRLGMVFQLLTTCLEVKSLKPDVLQELNEENMKNIFISLLQDDPLHFHDNADTMEILNFYIYALKLTSKLTPCDPKWMNFYRFCLLKNKQIYRIVAQAICLGNYEVKKLALDLTGATGSWCEPLASAITILDFTVLNVNTLKNHQEVPLVDNFAAQQVPITMMQDATLEYLLETVEKQINNNNNNESQQQQGLNTNLAASQIMQLYEHKFSNLVEAERIALANLEAATNRYTHLQHRVSRFIYEHNKLQQLNFQTMQNYEKQLNRCEDFSKEIENLNQQLDLKERKIEDSERIQRVQKEKCEETEKKLANLQELVLKLEHKCHKFEQTIVKKDQQLQNATEINNNLTTQINGLERDLKNTVKNLEDTKNALQAKSSLLDAIANFTNSHLSSTKSENN